MQRVLSGVPMFPGFGLVSQSVESACPCACNVAIKPSPGHVRAIRASRVGHPNRAEDRHTAYVSRLRARFKIFIRSKVFCLVAKFSQLQTRLLIGTFFRGLTTNADHY